MAFTVFQYPAQDEFEYGNIISFNWTFPDEFQFGVCLFAAMDEFEYSGDIFLAYPDEFQCYPQAFYSYITGG